MAELDRIQHETVTTRNVRGGRRWPTARLADEHRKRLLQGVLLPRRELHRRVSVSPLVSNSPDVEALDMGSSEHFIHWCLRTRPTRPAIAGDRNHAST